MAAAGRVTSTAGRDTLRFRGTGLTAPLADKPFKPYVYGATRSRAARAALDQAEAAHGKRPATLRGLGKASHDTASTDAASGTGPASSAADTAVAER